MTSPEEGTHHRLSLVSGQVNPKLADDIAENLGTELDPVSLKTFSNTELYTRYQRSVRGADVFVIQSHAALPEQGWSINDSIMQQRFLIDAARRASAHAISAVCPYLAYSRMDRKASGRESISGARIAKDIISGGADRIMSVDLHSQQAQGFIDNPFDHLTAEGVLIEWIKKWVEKNCTEDSEAVLVSPDAGRAKLVEEFALDIGVDWATVLKTRSKEDSDDVRAVGVLGNVVGRHCIIVDDMVDTAGTLTAAAQMLKDERAASVVAVGTHGILSDPATERINDSAIDLLVVTDTLPTEVHQQNLGDKLEVVSMAPVIAEAIKAVYEEGSVSELFHGKNSR